MFDCSKEITKFYNKEVKLPPETWDLLRSHRDANRDRLKKGLQKAEQPKPLMFISQGSYKMKTTIQHPKNDYDIDDGVAFSRDDLKSSQGNDKSALDARKMVRDALDDERFNKKPEVRNNCVRIYYNQGHHVDVPVYRHFKDMLDNDCIELASTDWKESNPEAVSEWFNNAVINKSPDETNGRQMRRIVCLLKAFARSRDSWNMPSGLILSVLADESYSAYEERDDEALHECMRRIYSRLCGTLEVRHPVVANEMLTKGMEDPKMKELRDRLKDALDELEILFDKDCTRQDVMKAWKKVFNHNFFDEETKDEGKAIAAGLTTTGAAPTSPVRKEGGGRFA